MRHTLALLGLFVVLPATAARGAPLYTYTLEVWAGESCGEPPDCADGLFDDAGEAEVLLSFEVGAASHAGDTVTYALHVLQFSLAIPGTGYTFAREHLAGVLSLQDNRPYNWEAPTPTPDDWYEDRVTLSIHADPLDAQEALLLFLVNDAYGTVASPPDMVTGTGHLGQRFKGFDATDGGSDITLPDGSTLRGDHRMQFVSVEEEVAEPVLLPLGLPAIALLLRARAARRRAMTVRR